MVPEELRKLVEDWRTAGSPEQPGIVWPSENWVASLPTARAYFGGLPARLSRPVLRQVCANAATSPGEAEHAFLAVMAWGFGRVGYGPYRTGQILDGTSKARSTLQQAAEVVASGDAVAAYRVLGDHGRAALPGLGPAFGTKYLYFCSPVVRHGALILDQLVAKWLAHHARVRLNQVVASAKVVYRPAP